MRRTFVLVLGLCVAAGFASAADYRIGALSIGAPFARATPPGARTGGAYFTVDNAGKTDDRLVAVSSPAAAHAELHAMAMDGGVMRMRALGALAIPAGGKLMLAPGGNHVMLLDLKRPLVAGESVPLMLTFEKAGTVEVTVAVTALGDMPKPAHP